MWYVMQVVSGQESRTVLLLERMISEECLEQCFVPMRRLAKKFHGTWNELTERLFPGYVVFVSGDREAAVIIRRAEVCPGIDENTGEM